MFALQVGSAPHRDIQVPDKPTGYHGKVEPLFEFIGNYWWLAFPLMGIMAGVGGAWEQRAKQRHKRRLEILQAKSQFKAAQKGRLIRGGPPPPAPQSQPAAQTAPGHRAAPSPRPTAELERVMAAHGEVAARWLEYELDVAKMIAFPAMSDGRQPLTASFLRAKKVADRLRPATAQAKITREQFVEYREAVTDFEVAFDVAERDARRVKDASFTELERKRLGTAKQLLTVAIDQAATPAERQLAYRRVREELDGLISLSDDAIEVLESKVSLELPDSATHRDASPTPGKPAPVPPQRGPDPPWPIPSRNHRPPPS